MTQLSYDRYCDEIVEQAQRGGTTRGQKLSEAMRAMPIVSIGEPETSPLQEALGLKRVPRGLQSKFALHDFYLVRFSCSFRPIHQESSIQWARFLVRLLPDDIGRQPLAYDLFPKEVVQEVKHQLRISVTPTLKFAGVEVGSGPAEFSREYLELQPRISAAGEGQSDPSWDYTEAQGATMQGSKRMYLLLKAPKGMPQGRAQLDLVADVKAGGVRVATVALRWRKQEGDQLTVKLWG